MGSTVSMDMTNVVIFLKQFNKRCGRMSTPSAVFPEEVDFFIESLKRFQVADIGSQSWLEQYEVILKLTQQAFIDASTNQEEVVKEKILLEGKVPVLVHEVHCIFVWRTKILPQLLNAGKLEASFVLYSVLYYEVNAIALLETLLFHRDSCEAIGESVLDLIDYCAHAVGLLIGSANKPSDKAITTESPIESSKQEIERLRHEMDFKIGLKCVTILSYLINHLDVLRLSASTRVITVHDIPCLIAETIHVKPWLRKSNGFEKFLDDTWTPVYGENILKVTKTEAQAWFCLHNLLFNEDVMRNYEINEFRRNQIGKCVGLLNEQILDQLPALIHLKQKLYTLQTGQASTGKRQQGLILEELPEIRSSLVSNANNYGWIKIVEAHKKIFVDLSHDEICSIAKKLSAAYNTDLFERIGEVKTTALKCSTCGKASEKKCSRCRSAVYCSRECQIADWTNHKELCHQYMKL